jgi:hypothetical protein
VIDTPYDNVPSRLSGTERLGTRLEDVVPVPRRLVTAQIGGAELAMHLDLGAAVSQLRQPKWPEAKLAVVETKLRMSDEAGIARDVTSAGIAEGVTVGRAHAVHTTFVPYVEKRFVVDLVDGALGLDFFQPYSVYANWDARTFYLKPRGDAAALLTARLGRWGTALPACPHPGCISAEIAQQGASVNLRVVRDAEAANHGLEVLLQVTAAPGSAVAPLLVELPAASSELSGALPRSYAGATLTVMDASPFPRNCFDKTGCILPLGSQPDPGAASPAPGAEPPGAPGAEPAAAPGPKVVVVGKLHRLSGDSAIAPSDAVVQAMAGKPLAVAIVKLCLGADGKVESTKLVKSSGVAAYDDQLQAAIKAGWAFEPFQIDGAAAAVCTTASIKAP